MIESNTLEAQKLFQNTIPRELTEKTKYVITINGVDTIFFWGSEELSEHKQFNIGFIFIMLIFSERISHNYTQKKCQLAAEHSSIRLKLLPQ